MAVALIRGVGVKVGVGKVVGGRGVLVGVVVGVGVLVGVEVGTSVGVEVKILVGVDVGDSETTIAVVSAVGLPEQAQTLMIIIEMMSKL
jgi:hypothetical protein